MHRDNSFFVDVLNVLAIHEKSMNWCYKHLREMHAYYKLKKHQFVNIWQFNEYENHPLDSPRPSIEYLKRKFGGKGSSGTIASAFS